MAGNFDGLGRDVTTGATFTANFTRLRDGDWGVSVRGGAVLPGQQLTVTKRSGRSKVVTVARVVWSDPAAGVSICAIVQDAPRGRGRSGGRGYSRSRRTGYGMRMPPTPADPTAPTALPPAVTPAAAPAPAAGPVPSNPALEAQMAARRLIEEAFAWAGD